MRRFDPGTLWEGGLGCPEPLPAANADPEPALFWDGRQFGLVYPTRQGDYMRLVLAVGPFACE